MTNPYKLFSTDENLEKGEGVTLEFDGFSITIHRAGGANRKFQEVFSRKMAPHRRKFDMGVLDQTTQRQLLAEIYAEAIIVGWQGVTDADGNALEFTKENVVKLLLDLPDLFDTIIDDSNNQKNFRKAALEADAKN